MRGLKLKSLIICCFIGVISKAQIYNMTNTVITTCSGSFYDDGGSGSNYNNNLNLTQTFTSPAPNYRMRVSFSAFNTEAGYDTLSVYDGATASAALFQNKYSGTTLPPLQYSTNQSLTFHFMSDAATVNPGWTATVSCFGISNITPTISSQSNAITITVNGSNTTFYTPPYANNVFLVHTVTTNTITGAAPTIINDLQLSSNFNIPCNADIGMYDLYVSQPGVGLTKIANAFNVTSYQINLTPNATTCFGMSNGAVSSTPSGGTGPYNYYWQPGSMTTQNITNVAVGTYSCTVTDGLGCVRSQIATVTQPSMLTMNVTPTNVLCNGASNGSASVSASGGTPVYTYNWSPSGGTASVATGLSAGNYTCTVVDANGCSMTNTLNITQPSAIIVNAGTDQAICFGSNASLNGSASGGTPGYSFQWTPTAGLSAPSAANTSASPSSTTIYTLTVTDANGCSVNDNMMLTVNSLPSASAVTTGTLDCVNSNVNVSASGASMYYWNGPGVVSGVGNPVATVNLPGIYTVTATGANGCNAYVTTAVTSDTTTPNVTANSGAICDGSNFIITASGASTYVWNTTATTPSINVTPSSTTAYTVTGTGANGCTASYSVLVTVYPLPSISISASSNPICSGSTTTLTITAPTAVTYLWNSGQTTQSIGVTPTISTTYSATVTDAIGCTNNNSFLATVNASKNIGGNIINETSGNVVLYKYSSTLSLWDSITFVPISASAYNFVNVDSANYVLKVIPAASTNQITYGASEISWQNATVINHGCTNNSVQTITVVPFANIGIGSGSMSGQITQALGFGQRPNGDDPFKPTAPGNPIGGIVVKGGRNPGGQMFAQTTTDPVTGTYTLTNIPDGQNYFILVDIPGLDTNLTYHRDLVAGNNQLTGLDFTVDSMYINPVNNSVGVNDINAIEHQLIVSPNPASDFININYHLQYNSTIGISIMDVLGKTVKILQEDTLKNSESYNQSFAINDLQNGVYFVKIKINNTISIIKLVISK